MNIYTTAEINNQFSTWLKIDDLIGKNTQVIEQARAFIDEDTVIVFTGAGTSGYIGDALVPYLNQGQKQNNYLSIYSTNIVDNPQFWLGNKKILLVSFARSGNSPESVEAVVLATRFAKACHHLIITCNQAGQLATQYPDQAIILPPETNDNGFAVTSSFSTMMLTAAKIFGLEIDLKAVVKNAQKLYAEFDYERFGQQPFANIIFLSNSADVGLTTELKLKFMELTSGQYSYYSEQFLNFRHGPKSVLSKPSIVFFLGTTDQITKKYEQDLVRELINDPNQPTVILFGDNELGHNWHYQLAGNRFERMMSIIPMMQQAAVVLSLEMGNDPDNPCPSGSVNRVVQGVEIHERMK